MTTSTRSRRRAGACGRTVDGDHVRDEDDDGFVVDDMKYDCGCQITRTQYHDGSVTSGSSTTTARSAPTSTRRARGLSRAMPAAYDVLLVGGGGAGLRAAIAMAETQPGLRWRSSPRSTRCAATPSPPRAAPPA